MKPSKSKLKEIFILWAIAHVDFCVKGHPSVPKDTMLFAGDLKGVTNPSHGDNDFKDFRVTQDVSQPIPDDTKLETSEALHQSQTGSGDTRMTPDVVGNTVTKIIEYGKGLKKDLNPAPGSEQTIALKSKGVPNSEPDFEREYINPFDEEIKFLNVAQVQELSDGDLIKYMAQKDTEVEKLNIEFLEYAKAHKVEEKAFINALRRDQNEVMTGVDVDRILKQEEAKPNISQEDLIFETRKALIEAAIQPSEADLHKFVHSKHQYNQAYQKTLVAAKNLVSKESLTPEALSKLTNKEYVKKVALFDKNVQQNLVGWKEQEDSMNYFLNSFFKIQAREIKQSQGTKKFDHKWEKANENVQPKSKEKGQPTDIASMKQAAKRQFIRNQSAHNPKGLEWGEDEVSINAMEKKVKQAEKKALRSANKVLPRNDLLRSAALKMKHIGQVFINFFKNVFALFSKLEKKPSQL